MPAPRLEWKTYEVAGGAAAMGMLATVAPGDDHPGLELPDLSAWSAPLDKAEILLETAAEVEHALMVQYLYAAYSLRSDDVTEPDQQNALDAWPLVLLSVAREEMGHLMTVQNLLLAL